MKKEGTGAPRNPDIGLTANVKVRELYFDEVPNTEVRFRGNTRRNSVSKTERENLPEEVREEVTYRDFNIRLRIASEIAVLDVPGRGAGAQSSANREEKQ